MVNLIIERSVSRQQEVKKEAVDYFQQRGLQQLDYTGHEEEVMRFVRARTKQFLSSDRMFDAGCETTVVYVDSYDPHDRRIRGLISYEHRCNLILFILVSKMADIPWSRRPCMDYKLIKSKEGHVFTVQLDNGNHYPSLSVIANNGRTGSMTRSLLDPISTSKIQI